MGEKSIRLVLCASLVFSIQLTTAQNLKYSIIWKGDSIGHLLANRYDSAEFNVYSIDSEVNFWFFGSRKIQYNYYTIYKEGALIKANTRYSRDGNLKEESLVLLNGNGYDIISDDDHRLMTSPYPIKYSVTTIYHNEPGQATRIFSERWGKVLNVRSAGPNRYSIEKPDGRQTEYFFENGICSKVVVENFFATFTFERSD